MYIKYTSESSSSEESLKENCKTQTNKPYRRSICVIGPEDTMVGGISHQSRWFMPMVDEMVDVMVGTMFDAMFDTLVEAMPDTIFDAMVGTMVDLMDNTMIDTKTLKKMSV